MNPPLRGPQPLLTTNLSRISSRADGAAPATDGSLESRVLDALRQVMDPDRGRDIVALGLIVEQVKGQAWAAVRPVAGSRPVPGVKNAIAVSSGKGGVGKSTVSVHPTCALQATGA